MTIDNKWWKSEHETLCANFFLYTLFPPRGMSTAHGLGSLFTTTYNVVRRLRWRKQPVLPESLCKKSNVVCIFAPGQKVILFESLVHFYPVYLFFNSDKQFRKIKKSVAFHRYEHDDQMLFQAVPY